MAIAVARCPVGAIYLLDEAEQRLWIRATSPGFEWLVGTYSLDVGAGLTGWTALNRTAAVVNDDPHDDPRYVSVPEADLDFRAAMTVPLISATDRLVGVITLHQRAPDGFFAADALPALNPIADLTATVIERSQLYSRSRRQIELARSISDLGDPLRSPASSRVALATLAERARLLLAAQTAALYTRAGTAWRLASSSLGDLDAPQDELANELLEPLDPERGARRARPPPPQGPVRGARARRVRDRAPASPRGSRPAGRSSASSSASGAPRRSRPTNGSCSGSSRA